MARRNYYEMLGLRANARLEVIEAAYRALAKLYFPRASRGDEELMRELNEAHEVLSKPEKRKKYDEMLFPKRPGNVIGNYRIIEQIAEGAFGKTFKAEHVQYGFPVCIKNCANVNPEYYYLLEEETKAMWDLVHYEIPVPRELLELEDGSLALVMSYVPGLTLEQVVQKVGALDAETVSWILERTLNSLMYMHYHSVIHGDIKPQNIIMQLDQHTVSVVDFGLSLLKPHAGSSSKGYTPLFAPPKKR